MIILGNELKKISKEKKLSQKEVAKETSTRLDFKLNDILLFEGESNQNYDLLEDLKTYCDNNQFEKAFQVMSYLSKKAMLTTYEKKGFTITKVFFTYTIKKMFKKLNIT